LRDKDPETFTTMRMSRTAREYLVLATSRAVLDLFEDLDTAERELEEARAALTSDAGVTWEEECMNARRQRDVARTALERIAWVDPMGDSKPQLEQHRGDIAREALAKLPPRPSVPDDLQAMLDQAAIERQALRGKP